MIQLTKCFDYNWQGKCSAIEVTVNYDPKEQTAIVDKVFMVISKYRYTAPKTRSEDLPHIYEDMTGVFQTWFPDFFKMVEGYDWGSVYAEHEDLTLNEREAA